MEDKNIILIVIIIGAIISFYFILTNEPIENSEIEIQEVKDAGLNDLVRVGGVSFELVGVELYEAKGGYHTLWFDYTITNEGENMEEVSNCGTLLFEGGAQYKYQVTYNGEYIITECSDYEMVPGTRVRFLYGFRFSKSSYTREWKEVPGSKITFFSQQDGGLVKYVIDKSEITLTKQGA